MKKILLALMFTLLSAALYAAPDPAGKLPAEVTINGVEFVRIPGGWFSYPVAFRDPKNNYEFSGTREIRTWVDTYYLAKYEARARDFMRFMNTRRARHAQEYHAKPDGSPLGTGAREGCAVRVDSQGEYVLVSPSEDLPVTHLSWNLANEFATAMGFRLPTEAEWVRAFRGDDQRMYPWGGDYPDDTFAGFQEGATACNVQPVSSYPKGRSPYGIHNMAGNVFEYVADWYSADYLNGLKDGVRNPFAATPSIAPGQEVPRKRLRGGRWASSTGELTIYANIDSFPPDDGFNCFGARFAIDVEAVRRHLAGNHEARN